MRECLELEIQHQTQTTFYNNERFEKHVPLSKLGLPECIQSSDLYQRGFRVAKTVTILTDMTKYLIENYVMTYD